MDFVLLQSDNRKRWLQSLIDCYKIVFAAPPWNEDWWTDELVLDVISQYEITGAEIILAIKDEKVIAFTWGRVTTLSDLSEELGISLPGDQSAQICYIKDIGVSEVCRNKGVAAALLKQLLARFKKVCDPAVTVYARTLEAPEPSVVYGWFPRIGFTVVTHYPDDGERAGQVILGCSLEKIIL